MVGVGGGLVLAIAVGGWEALLTAAVALAAARATAKGMVGLAGEGSHLDLFVGLTGSPPSWVAWRVLFPCLAGLEPVLEDLGDVLVEVGVEPLVLLPPLVQILVVDVVLASLTASLSVSSDAVAPAVGGSASAAPTASSGASGASSEAATPAASSGVSLSAACSWP